MVQAREMQIMNNGSTPYPQYIIRHRNSHWQSGVDVSLYARKRAEKVYLNIAGTKNAGSRKACARSLAHYITLSSSFEMKVYSLGRMYNKSRDRGGLWDVFLIFWNCISVLCPKNERALISPHITERDYTQYSSLGHACTSEKITWGLEVGGIIILTSSSKHKQGFFSL